MKLYLNPKDFLTTRRRRQKSLLTGEGLPFLGNYVKRLLLFLALGLLSTFAFAGTMTTYYVSTTGDDRNPGTESSPFRTIAKARDVVRTKNSNMSGDIIVYLRGGTYTVSDTITFAESDSGTGGYSVIYKAYSDEKPIVSGGEAITGWSMHDSTNNIYKATTNLQFRQLYVNGGRAIRARQPNRSSESNLGPYYTGAARPGSAPYTITVNPSTLGNWQNISQVEVVINDHWIHKRVRMAGYSSGTISLQSPENSSRVLPFENQYNTPFYFENAYEFLNAEGEWYLDSSNHTLYYKPRNGENMSSIEVIAPTVETLVNIKGSSSSILTKYIQFQGITFQYSTWMKPSSMGYLVLQGANWLDVDGSTVPGAIQIQNADNVRFDGCTIRHTGANAIVAPVIWGVDDCVRNCSFINNLVTDTSAGGINLLLFSANSSGNTIINNVLENGGRCYSDGCGILVTFAPNISIQHNEIRNYGYTGISLGWSWDDTNTAAINHEVSYNNIHDVMQVHDDGGAIYSLGKVPGTNIHDNYVYSIKASPYQGGYNIVGIYYDAGSSLKTAQKNVFDGIPRTFFAMSTNHDNTLIDNYYNCVIGTVSSLNTLQNNLFVSGTNWPQDAVDIMNRSGLITKAPTAPSDLTAIPVSSNQIDLSWTDNGSYETGFKVETKVGADGAWTQIATLAANSSSYSDRSPSVLNQYCYRVRATNNGNDSAYSNEAGATNSVSSHAVPGKIEAENYTSMSGIQTAPCNTDGGQLVTSVDVGDWLDYKVDVPTSGWYTATYQVAGSTIGQIQLRQGSVILGAIDTPNTGGDLIWTTVSIPVHLTAGLQTLRMQCGAGSWKLNWLNFTSGTVPAVVTPSFSLATGTYTSGHAVTISTPTSGASIRYTTDGSTPTSNNGTLYSGPVNINTTTTLKAIAYNVSMMESAVASINYTIIDRYVVWCAEAFGMQAGDPAVAGATADPNANGIPNMLEYALGSDPTGCSTNLTLPVCGISSNNRLTITFSRNPTLTDINYIVEATSDLQGPWTPIASSTAGAATANLGTAFGVSESDAPIKTVIVEDYPVITSTSNRYLRLKITKP